MAVTLKPAIVGGFLRGPIPLSWLKRLCHEKCGRTAHSAALAVWYVAGLRKSSTVTFTSKVALQFGLDRTGKARGIKSLEAAGLIAVEKRPRKNPLITILEVSNGCQSQVNADEHND
jgi:hypothetical protein